MSETLLYRLKIYDLLRRLFFWQMSPEIFCEACKFLGVKNENLRESFKEAGYEYIRLFIGAKHIPAPLYASVYLSKSGIMMQEPALKARKFYAKFDFEMINKFKEPDDHIGAMFEFLFALSAKSIRLQKSQNLKEFEILLTAQSDFIREQILTWSDKFLNKILLSSKNEFWIETAKFCKEFLNDEIASLANLHIDMKGKRYA